MRKKISVIGTGNVGSALGQRLGQMGFADVILVDIIEGMPQGKAIDMMHSHPIVGSNAKIVGTNGYEETANSDLVIMVARSKPLGGAGGAQVSGGRNRLLLENMEMLKGITERAIKHSPDCIIIVVTNPVDAMARAVLHFSRFAKNCIMGLSGGLDTARYRAMIADEMNVSAQDIRACIIGAHGETMIPIPRMTTIGGVPITELLSADKVDAIVARARHGAGEVVKLLKTATPYYAPAMAIAEMAEAVILDKKRVMPVSAYLEGEFGASDVFIDVPAKIGASGIEQVMQFNLSPTESEAFKQSAQSIKDNVAMMNLG
ncbi:MAG: malate dehydrogenase [Chloroflexi bacterium]|jgi:malate dehydrogenase|nr:malate dehydrogenase [Chloroflexota bacterium]MBT7081447.1 malate dehydrogenase [Chloroflexota bacterium]